jgi:hypothetical protein
MDSETDEVRAAGMRDLRDILMGSVSVPDPMKPDERTNWLQGLSQEPRDEIAWTRFARLGGDDALRRALGVPPGESTPAVTFQQLIELTRQPIYEDLKGGRYAEFAERWYRGRSSDK